MRLKRFIIMIFGAVIFISSCTKINEELEIPVDQSGEIVEVAVSFRTANELSADGVEIPFTRAPIATDQNEINNVWVFQFDGTGDNAVLVTEPYYVDQAAITDAIANNGGLVPMPLINSNSQTHRLVFTANINNKSYEWDMKPGVHTLSDLKGKHLRIDHESYTYGDIEENLIMSGSVTTVVQSGTNINGGGSGVALSRSVALIELNLNVSAIGYKVIGVRVRNASDRLDIFDNQMTFSSDPYPHSVENIDYPSETDANGLVVHGGAARTFRWFVPRNTRGTSASTTAADKNIYAPAGATYIEIAALNAGNKIIVYRIYPGANDYNDYNVVPNHKYTLNLTITGDGGAVITDSRIEDYGNKRFTGNSNSFIINPPPFEGLPAREFQIPITQVNRYWGGVYEGYGGLNQGIISSSDPWNIQLLWQDHSDIVREVTDSDYDASKHISFVKSSGTGAGTPGNEEYFTIRVPAGVAHGNFVATIRRPYGITSIIWSWHFWVTDYNPDPKHISISPDKFIYPVPGGQVERYYAQVFGYDTNNSDNKDPIATYNSAVTATKPLTQSVVMDRNLGTFPGSHYMTNVITFQYGRKDPFPSMVPLYDIHGTELPTTSQPAFPEQYWYSYNANAVAAPTYVANSNVQITATIANPMRHYSGWQGHNATNVGWNDSQAPTNISNNRYTTKSIFDPCPEGWRMLIYHAYQDFRHNYTINTEVRGLYSTYEYRYYPNFIPNGLAPGYVSLYAASPYRSSSGAFSTNSSYNYYAWSPFPGSETTGYYTLFSKTANNYNSSINRSNSYPVRCSSEYSE